MSDTRQPRKFIVGDFVKFYDHDDREWLTGEIVNSPGRVFVGWNVKLDKGGYRGVATRSLRLVRAAA